ncbi:O-antigen ligase family protein [Halopseudomonas salegens]|uniref:O-antigen ligase n=1 Tax=Halopseudomonas salegens TaxID=1434072 RepID=A0A1H2GKB4_9GAMM|nr:O-antigen ligase family protein [Halopseudomonas salegens]SDU19848.1 O-antigen ligase [Halopseudomonas salegens]
MEQLLSRFNRIWPEVLGCLLLAVMAGLATLHFYGPGWLSYAWVGMVVLSLALQLTALGTLRLGNLLLCLIGILALLMHTFSFLEGEPWLSWPRLIHLLAIMLLLWVLRAAQGGRYVPGREGMLAVWLSLVVFAACVINGQALYLAEWQIFLLQFSLFTLCVRCFPALVQHSWPYFVIVLLILGLMLLSNALAASVDEVMATSDRVFHMLGHLLFAWSVYACSRQYSWRPVYLFWSVFAALLVCTLAVAMLWFTVDQPRLYDWFSKPPLFGHIRHMGYFLCFAAIVATYWFFSARLLQHYLAGVAVLLGFSLLFWNGGRGAALAVMLAGSLVLFCSCFSWQRLRSMAYLVILALAMSLLFRVDVRGVGWFDALWRSDAATSVNALSSGRLWIWSVLWPFIQERIWFGWGGNGFVSVWGKEASIIQAHNGLFQLLLEWGLITTAAILGLISYYFLRGSWVICHMGRRAQPPLLLGLMVTLGMLVLAVFDGIFYYGAPGSFLALGLGLLAAGLKLQALHGPDAANDHG